MLDFAMDGIDAAIDAVRRVVRPVNNKRIGENAAAALEPIAEDARRLVPVESGDLRDTIRVSLEFADGGFTDGSMVVVGPLAAGDARHVFYAHFLEFGTITMRARPFLGPAIAKHQELVFDVLGERIGRDMIGAI
ncbi:HK97-gp10 family putative phage morphogenesis protein [Qipengyuania sp.]|uniref:HK97-gp10 family putative phage morphogenesis protein n=1 Tax=Qipengyuania sp. TaxID=2004515 RepID=UPI003513BBC3